SFNIGFDYIVAPGQATPNLTIESFNLNGGRIYGGDLFLRDADLSNLAIAGTLLIEQPPSYDVRSFLTYQSTFDQLASGFNVVDRAHNIGAAFDQLIDTHIVWIKISDNAAVTLTAWQVVSDAEAIGKLQNANGSPPGIGITDTAANVATNLDALQAL